MQKHEKHKRKTAVALKYDLPQNQAPVIVAKGRGKIADAILAMAEQHDIPITADDLLAEQLWQLELHCEIPEELYEAVAEILAYIFQQRRQFDTKAT